MSSKLRPPASAADLFDLNLRHAQTLYPKPRPKADTQDLDLKNVPFFHSQVRPWQGAHAHGEGRQLSSPGRHVESSYRWHQGRVLITAFCLSELQGLQRTGSIRDQDTALGVLGVFWPSHQPKQRRVQSLGSVRSVLSGSF